MAKKDFRVTSIFNIIIRICMKNVEFCMKTSKFLPKRCLLIFCIFYLNEKELNQQVCLKKYVEHEIEHERERDRERDREREGERGRERQREKERDRERQREINPTLKTFLKLLKNFHLFSFTLVTNYHKLSLLALVVRH